MPTDNHGKGYTYKASGTNSQGNHYCARDHGSDAPSQNSYHYSNQDGSYYYSNSDGSTYHNNGQGESQYSPPASGSSGSESSGSSTGSEQK
ncbi:hypothetical protein N7448_005797 [Penicillium atrosanguineum]|uniref:Uncharacterized protein n=1 Tax=Penicillium atrosanguineum TaxID=1132637 RepID=A0A9W9PQH2_9EURO|nr:uncharacterized protein N7443_009560 [Penicillium atrosanguineum]KAJ5131639.1 hypothetical protein N7448_005797 [Penicillium atrosanguineum]KAJ5138156.1 hypothetical protein N7526_004389 [Penicillium atrosanguineum]KAJ5289307.1 hypothetical protein N7443_009560 [Penicillium atrosanguineum]KAJ5307121.1 hypothetical protein N7476_007777 [Penicillium atrosanguineum]